MGAMISGKMMVGLPYPEFKASLPEDLHDNFEDSIDCGELDFASPYYDSPRSYWFVGFDVKDSDMYNYVVSVMSADAKLREWYRALSAPSGVFKVIGTAHVT